MIICRTPTRISLLGGGTDQPEYFHEFGGETLSLAQKKYTFISLHKRFQGGVRLAYSKVEVVSNLEEIQHPIFKAMLSTFAIDEPLEINTFAEIPSIGTGLGASSSFSVGLLNALSRYMSLALSRPALAERAWEIESLASLGPIGKQDHYACAVGGVNNLKYLTSNEVMVRPIILSSSFSSFLEQHLLLVWTGVNRDASFILQEQSKILQTNQHSLEARHLIRDSVAAGVTALMQEDIPTLAAIVNEMWIEKQKFGSVTNSRIDELIEFGLKNGCVGAKLLGAGGGGFILFVCREGIRENVKKAFNKIQCETYDVEIDSEGTTILYEG